MKMVNRKIEELKLLHPEMARDNETFLKEYFNTKYNIQTKPTYSQLLRRPRPDDVSDKFKDIKNLED